MNAQIGYAVFDPRTGRKTCFTRMGSPNWEIACEKVRKLGNGGLVLSVYDVDGRREYKTEKIVVRGRLVNFDSQLQYQAEEIVDPLARIKQICPEATSLPLDWQLELAIHLVRAPETGWDRYAYQEWHAYWSESYATVEQMLRRIYAPYTD